MDATLGRSEPERKDLNECLSQLTRGWECRKTGEYFHSDKPWLRGLLHYQASPTNVWSAPDNPAHYISNRQTSEHGVAAGFHTFNGPRSSMPMFSNLSNSSGGYSQPLINVNSARKQDVSGGKDVDDCVNVEEVSTDQTQTMFDQVANNSANQESGRNQPNQDYVYSGDWEQKLMEAQRLADERRREVAQLAARDYPRGTVDLAVPPSLWTAPLDPDFFPPAAAAPSATREKLHALPYIFTVIDRINNLA